jgi:bifunctional non-homologous end joining protein LigD
MLATSGPVPTGAGWAFEVKFDGVRATCPAVRGGLRLFSRNANDISTSYPEITSIDVQDGLVLDGELVALDERGRPDFGLLQRRMHVQHPSPSLRAEVPVQLVVFDVLARDGVSTMDLPYVERREILANLELAARPGLTVPANFTDAPGELVLAAVAQQGLEGVVAKRLASIYVPGRRSKSWIKTPLRRDTEVVVVGWSPSSGNQHVLGALLLAVHDEDGALVYAGDVGTGFTDAVRRALLEQLHGLARGTPPFDGPTQLAHAWPGRARRGVAVHWIEPRLVGEIEYRAFSPGGGFRHPSWRGLRPDREPGDVGRPAST